MVVCGSAPGRGSKNVEMAAGENGTSAVDGDTSESERVKRELGEARLNADHVEACLVEERTAAIEKERQLH